MRERAFRLMAIRHACVELLALGVPGRVARTVGWPPPAREINRRPSWNFLDSSGGRTDTEVSTAGPGCGSTGACPFHHSLRDQENSATRRARAYLGATQGVDLGSRHVQS